MSRFRHRKQSIGAAMAGAVMAIGASAIMQTNGGLVASAYASSDESPKETIRKAAPLPVQQPAAPKAPAQPAAPPKKPSV